jgi:hypothetical protein
MNTHHAICVRCGNRWCNRRISTLISMSPYLLALILPPGTASQPLQLRRTVWWFEPRDPDDFVVASGFKHDSVLHRKYRLRMMRGGPITRYSILRPDVVTMVTQAAPVCRWHMVAVPTRPPRTSAHARQHTKPGAGSRPSARSK